MGSSKSLMENDEMKQQFAGLILLDRIISQSNYIHASFMEKDDDLLEPILDVLTNRELVEINENNYYAATEKGQKLYQTLLDQQLSYATHFDIYSHVDLEEGSFADKEQDLLDDARWEDLRVAVAEFKGIDPYRMVFLAMLSDESFFDSSDWRFRLAMGNLFEELEEVVQTQVGEDDLAYEDEEGLVSGHEVLEDVICQGAEMNQQRFQAQKEEHERRQQENAEGGPVTIIEEGGHYGGYGYGYDPMMTLGAYAASAMFIETMWHAPYW